MRNNNFIKAKNFMLALAVVLAAIATIQTLDLNGNRYFAVSGAKAAVAAELKSATEAKRALARIGSPNFAKIKDARKRDAMQKSYDAIKALANNTSQEQEATLAANLTRAGQALKAFPPAKAVDFQDCEWRYKNCAEQCKVSGMCSLCHLSNDLCVQASLIKAWIDACVIDVDFC